MSENIIKKSIFKQEIIRPIYDVKNHIHEYKSLRRNITIDTYISEYRQRVEEKIIYQGDYQTPPLNKGDRFYIEEIHEIVTIEDKILTTNGNILYYVQPKFIEDEESIKSKKRAEEIQEQNIVLQEKLVNANREIDKLENFKRCVENSFWFKFINIEEDPFWLIK